jgi:hypothetical protein
MRALRSLKWACWTLLHGLDFLLRGFVAGGRPATADDANADYGMDGLFDGHRVGPSGIPRPGERHRPR